MPGPAYTVRTSRLLLRCWDPADAPQLMQAIVENLDHLRPWMPWARDEPENLDAKIERLRKFRANFDTGQAFSYGIYAPDQMQVLGSIGLHPRVGPGGMDIGYWIHREHSGRGYISEAAAALTRIAFELHAVDRVEIHCAPDNHRSAAVPQRLGFTHEATLRRRKLTDDSPVRDEMIWTLFREQFESSPAAGAEFEAFDAAGRRLV